MRIINTISVRLFDGIVDEWTDNYSESYFSDDSSAFLVCSPDDKDKMMAWYNTNYVTSIIIKKAEV